VCPIHLYKRLSHQLVMIEHTQHHCAALCFGSLLNGRRLDALLSGLIESRCDHHVYYNTVTRRCSTMRRVCHRDAVPAVRNASRTCARTRGLAAT